MAQNLLFMLEVDVLELIINQWNECAPPEYPLNAEIAFRSSVYFSIPEEDFGNVKDESGHEIRHTRCQERNNQTEKDNSGQGCIFILEKSVEEDDYLTIRVYKKRSEKCKFLIGTAHYRVKEMFDKVMIRYIENYRNATNTEMMHENGNQLLNRQSAGEESRLEGVDRTGSLSASSRRTSNERNDSQEMTFRTAADTTRIDSQPIKTDQPVSELRKMSFPLYNSEDTNVGSIVILMRLSCMGSQMCSSTVYPPKSHTQSTKQLVCPTGSADCMDIRPAIVDPCPGVLDDDTMCLVESMCSDVGKEDSSSSSKRSSCSEIRSKPTTIRPRVDDAAYDEFEANLNGCGLAIRVLKNSHKVSAVRRLENDSITKAVPTTSPKSDIKRVLSFICKGFQNVCGGEQKTQVPAQTERSLDIQKFCECVLRIMQCEDGNNEHTEIPLRRRDETRLTKLSGKNRKTRCMDNDQQLSTGNGNSLIKKILDLCVKYCSNRNMNLAEALQGILCNSQCDENLSAICQTLGQYLENDRNVVCDHLRKETVGRVYNAPCLPKIRGNIKYPTATNYGTADFALPLPEECDENGVDQYRRKDLKRECCVQIDGVDIDNTMRGVNKKLPHGIEICRKGTMDLDSDVFVLKMGKKTALSDKKGLVEIELRTPKGPSGGRVQHVSVASQVDEEMVTERVSSKGKTSDGKGDKKKGKGKSGKKGKKGKK